MNTIIFGNNSIRPYLINQLLAYKHNVKVYSRHALEEVPQLEHTELISGSVFDEVDIKKALEKVDVAISVINTSSSGNDVALSLGIKRIVQVMEEAGLKRLIILAGFGILTSKEEGKYLYELTAFPEQLRYQAEEQAKAVNYLKQTSINWTAICPISINGGKATGQYHLFTTISFNENYHTLSITTGDLVNFILNEMTDEKYLNKKVGIAN